MLIRILFAIINVVAVLSIIISGYFAFFHFQLHSKVIEEETINTPGLMDVIILVVSIGA